MRRPAPDSVPVAAQFPSSRDPARPGSTSGLWSETGPFDHSGLPAWFEPLAARVDGERAQQPANDALAVPGWRRSAVLVLFGEGLDGPDVLLIKRADSLRSHAGQPAFPGGTIDPGDSGPVGAALREAEEETGLDPSGVQVVGVLADLFVPVSRFVVAPVLAWWRSPSPVRAVSPAEVASVCRVPLEELLDPANRLSVRSPSSTPVAPRIGPAFRAGDMLVWGFTGGVLDGLFRLAGWELPWDREQVEDPPPSVLALDRRSGPALRSADSAAG